jgi:serine/threonine protein kinase
MINRDLFNFKFRSLSHYNVIEVIGEGTYGRVFRANELATKKNVAMKYIRMDSENEGFPITCLREIMVLRKLNHKNIVKLNDIVYNAKKKATYLVFEYMNHDLSGLLQNQAMVFDESTIYQITRQLLNGLQYCHDQQVVHRDLKTSNILVDSKGQVKIADFGLARYWVADRPFTNKVVSLWYRPIELLLGYEIYDFSADIWSLGCIICELFRRTPLFACNTELSMIGEIYNLCGTPDFNYWNVKKLKNYVKPRPRPRNLKNTLSKSIPPLALDLVDQMLMLDPTLRITASDALQSPWMVKMKKLQLEPMKLPVVDSFEMKMQKARKHHNNR